MLYKINSSAQQTWIQAHSPAHSTCIKNCIATQQNTGLLLIQSCNIACPSWSKLLFHFSLFPFLNISKSRPSFRGLGPAEVKVSEVAIQNTLWKHCWCQDLNRVWYIYFYKLVYIPKIWSVSQSTLLTK